MERLPTDDCAGALRRAAEIVGSVRKLEREASLPRGAVSRSLNGQRKRVPIEVAAAVSRATGGAVKISDIVPTVLEAVRQERNTESEAAER
jgi:DNA-binding transcriptional regulator YdaS (Cro superfamily)